MSSRRVLTDEDLHRMVDNWENDNANESNLPYESECEYFKRRSMVMGLTLYGFWVSPIQYNCKFLAKSNEHNDDNMGKNENGSDEEIED